MSSSARLIGKPAATARSQNPLTSAASSSPRRPALVSHTFNARMSSSAIMLISGSNRGPPAASSRSLPHRSKLIRPRLRAIKLSGSSVVKPGQVAADAPKGRSQQSGNLPCSIRSWIGSTYSGRKESSTGGMLMDAPNQEFVLAGSLEELEAKGRLVVHGRHRPILVIYDRGRVFALRQRFA